MRHATLLSLLLLAPPAFAQDAPLIGVAAPLSGPSAILGEQVVAGAAAGVDDPAGIFAADDECSAEGGAGAARAFVEMGVEAVVGFLCTSAIEAALPILTEGGIPVIDVGVRADRLTDRRERTGHLVWRIAPRDDGEANAIADFVRREWGGEPFGIIEDGSPAARDLADEVRARLQPDAIEPALVDNYRPAEEVQFALARRILQSGVTRILAFGTRSDVATLIANTAELGLDLDVLGGEQLIDAPGEEAALPVGTRAIGIDDGVGRMTDAGSGQPVREGYHLPARAAVEIAREALRRARETGGTFADAMGSAPFETVLGPVGFGALGDADLDPYQPLVFDGTAFVPEPQS